MTLPGAAALSRVGGRLRSTSLPEALPFLLGTAFFVALFAHPARLLARDWWNDPDAGHGLLLAPVALWLAAKEGLAPERRPAPLLGCILLVGAILIRYVGELASELFTMRFSMVLALMGLVVFAWGVGQLRRWWLPAMLLTLAIPLPDTVTNALSLPLQFRASRIGAGLLEWRHIPHRLSGNVIDIPGYRLFVAEACSGLRSLTALLSLGVLIGGIWLRAWPTRVLLVLAAIPVAVLLNGVRIFLTGFLMLFVGPEAGQGFMHMSEGWLIFAVALGVLGVVGMGFAAIERRLLTRRAA